jgi:hypothetical protein
MAYAQMKREVLQFESGMVYELALKYPAGKPVSNGRIMYSTTDEAVFFVDPFDAEAISGLNLKPGEKFRLVKQGGRNGNIEVAKAESVVEQPVIRQTAPAAPANTESTQQLPQPQNSSYSRMMASSYIAAIDALMIAHDYAESKGLQFKISPGEVRASAHCIFIASSRGGR